MKKKKWILGTRGSPLALWQAEHIAKKIREQYTDVSVELKIIKTQGDKILDVSLSKIGGKGLFIKEIEEALLSSDIDFAVHSLKDMPAVLPTQLTFAAIPLRADPSDVLITKEGTSLSLLPKGAVVGTSSLRRKTQLIAQRPDLKIIDLRGNIDTRLKRLEQGNFDAIILAKAGIDRLGLVYKGVNLPFIPAVAQGALALECRKDDAWLVDALQFLNDPETNLAVTAERKFLETLSGNCQVPLGAWARKVGDSWTLSAFIGDPDGGKLLKTENILLDSSQLSSIAVNQAEELLKQGGDEILQRLNSL